MEVPRDKQQPDEGLFIHGLTDLAQRNHVRARMAFEMDTKTTKSRAQL